LICIEQMPLFASTRALLIKLASGIYIKQIYVYFYVSIIHEP